MMEKIDIQIYKQLTEITQRELFDNCTVRGTIEWMLISEHHLWWTD